MPQHEGFSWLPFWGQRMGRLNPEVEAEPGWGGQQAWALLDSSLVGGRGQGPHRRAPHAQDEQGPSLLLAPFLETGQRGPPGSPRRFPPRTSSKHTRV